MKMKIFALLNLFLFVGIGISEGGTIKYLTNDAIITSSVMSAYLPKPAVVYDPINQRYLVAWNNNDAAVYAQLIDKNGTLIGEPKRVLYEYWGVGSPVAVFDSINSRYAIFHWNTMGIAGSFVDLDGNVTSEMTEWVIYPNRQLRNSDVTFNPVTGRFLVRVGAYYTYDVDGKPLMNNQLCCCRGYACYGWWGENERAVCNSHSGEFFITMNRSEYGGYFAKDDFIYTEMRGVSLAYDERVIGYDKDIAQYVLLGNGYLANLSPDGTYAGEKRIIQGLAGYDNLTLNDRTITIDYERKRLLMVFDYTYQPHQQYLQSPLSIALINFDGSLFTDITEFPSTNVVIEPRVAFDSVNNRHLLVWLEPNDPYSLSLHVRLISGDVDNTLSSSPMPSIPTQSQGQGSGTNNQGTNTASGLQTAPGLQKK